MEPRPPPPERRTHRIGSGMRNGIVKEPREGYTVRFYEERREGARRSARAIVPIVLDLLRPRSLVDIGGGEGTWLAVFREHGVEDVLGVDGPWVDRSRLEIPAGRFREADLTQPIRLDREFDLTVSLEVAEHLPA